jgi:hypothetical protein
MVFAQKDGQSLVVKFICVGTQIKCVMNEIWHSNSITRQGDE